VKGFVVDIRTGATINGNVDGEKDLYIRDGARLVGDLRTSHIHIEDGAYFQGSMDIVKPPADAAEA
jgi:cytoskeletal protein CcmA (bactofilin family)